MESEMIFILLLALIVLGPRRLPEIGRQIGRALAEFRRAKNEFAAQIEDEVRRLELEEKSAPSAPAPQAENKILPPGSNPLNTVTSSISSPSGNGSENGSENGDTVGNGGALVAAPGSHA